MSRPTPQTRPNRQIAGKGATEGLAGLGSRRFDQDQDGAGPEPPSQQQGLARGEGQALTLGCDHDNGAGTGAEGDGIARDQSEVAQRHNLAVRRQRAQPASDRRCELRAAEHRDPQRSVAGLCRMAVRFRLCCNHLLSAHCVGPRQRGPH